MQKYKIYKSTNKKGTDTNKNKQIQNIYAYSKQMRRKKTNGEKINKRSQKQAASKHKSKHYYINIKLNKLTNITKTNRTKERESDLERKRILILILLFWLILIYF